MVFHPANDLYCSYLQDSSVFLCIMMDYFPKGTLENVLEKCREKKEVLDEEVSWILVLVVNPFTAGVA